MSALTETHTRRARRRRGERREDSDRRSVVLVVEFVSPDGLRWSAVGGGTSVAAAIAFARECSPADHPWEAVGWSDLYGK